MSYGKEGDWKCPCGMTNFAYRESCYNCKIRKLIIGYNATATAATAASSSASTDNLMDNWKCTNCHSVNFAFRTACYNCNQLKHTNGSATAVASSSSASPAADKSASHWKCINCRCVNFAFRTICYNCDYHAPISVRHGDIVAAALPQQPPPVDNTYRPGDWKCTKCNSPVPNFKWRETCRNCDTSRWAMPPPAVFPIAPAAAPVVEVNDKKLIATSDATLSTSECVICMDGPREYCLITCMHLCMCEVCSRGIKECPMCRKPVTSSGDIRKVFFS